MPTDAPQFQHVTPFIASRGVNWTPLVIKQCMAGTDHGQGADSIQRCHRTSIRNPIVEIRRYERSSYLHNGISYTGKMTSLYWIRAQVLTNYFLGSSQYILTVWIDSILAIHYLVRKKIENRFINFAKQLSIRYNYRVMAKGIDVWSRQFLRTGFRLSGKCHATHTSLYLWGNLCDTLLNIPGILGSDGMFSELWRLLSKRIRQHLLYGIW